MVDALSAGHLLLVDASGFAYRAFAVANPVYREQDGEPVGAILAFMSLIWRLRGAAESDPPTHGVAVFDPPGKTFRHKLYPAYKANRPAARKTELSKQLVVMRSAADVLGLTPVEAAGFEADDTIATLARRAREAGMRTTIVSSDKDFGQLVEDGWCEIVDPMQKRRIRAAEVEAKFGVPPSQVAAVQALAGDMVDGIPGIQGLGLERAAGLVRRFGTVEGVLANVAACRWPKVRVQLARKGPDALLFLKLTTLRRDVPLDVDFSDLTIKPIMRAHLEEIAKALGASSRIEAMFSTEPKLARVVPAVNGKALDWWREELAVPGQRLPDEPQCGFYKRRLQKGAVFVPARIWREPETDIAGEPTGKDVMRCEVGGKARDPNAEWTRLAMNPITEADFRFETADSEHAKKWRPGDPKATPHVPIDLTKAKPPHNPRPMRKRT